VWGPKFPDLCYVDGEGFMVAVIFVQGGRAGGEMAVGWRGRRKSRWSKGELVGAKVDVRGSPTGCRDVDVQKSVRGWCCEVWGEVGVASRSPPMMSRVSRWSEVSSS